MYGGIPIILPNWFVEEALKLNYLKHKEGTTNGEMELVNKVQ